jgi:glycosyltransferase involved in cell wall biosynthesis
MKINPNYIIWIGSVFDDEMVLDNAAISPAANKWQFNFITALNNIDFRVINIGHCPERIYPFGKLFVDKRKTFAPDEIRLISSSFLNLPILRTIELNILSTIKLARLIRKHKEKPVYLIGYNTYSYNVIPLLFSKFVERIKWISIVADPMYVHSNKVNPFNTFADAQVFLSYKLFSACNAKMKLHLDGGITRTMELNKEILQKDERIILYSGAIAQHTGIELLVKAFSLIHSSNFRLIICGKGNNELLTKAIKKNNKITFLGMVDEQKLAFLYSVAYLFVNPRLINEKSNHANFPSKLLEYLSWCKPVISTYTGGIHPVYNEIIEFIYSDNPQDLADKIDEIAAWDNFKYVQKSDRIKSFVEKNKIWSKVIIEFNEWARQV